MVEQNIVSPAKLTVVADSLYNLATTGNDDELKACYARSSYNRYYYSTFWTIRALIVEIQPSRLDSLPHKDAPDILRKINKQFESFLAKRGEIIAKSKYKAKELSKQIAQDLEFAYEVRSKVDYKPIDSFNEETGWKVHLTKLSQAKNWPRNTEQKVATLRRLYEDNEFI